METMNLHNMLYSIISFPLNRLENRVKIKRVTAGIDAATMGKLLKETERVSNSWKFWVFMPFAWNIRNAKKFPIFYLLFCAAAIPIISAISISVGISHQLAWSIGGGLLMLFLILPFLVFAMEASINNAKDPDLALIRAWLLVHTKKSGKTFSLSSLSEAIESTLNPLPEDQYKAKLESLNKIGKICMLLSFTLIGVSTLTLLWPTFTYYSEFYMAIFLISTFLLCLSPLDFIFESQKRPLEYDTPTKISWSRPQTKITPTLDLLRKAYYSPKTLAWMRIKSRLIDLLGPFSAWTSEYTVVSLVLILEGALLAGLYCGGLLVRFYNMAILLGAMLLLMAPFLVLSNWMHGGGMSKAMARRSVFRRIASARRYEDLITSDQVMEIYASASYNKEAKFLSDNELLVKLLVASVGGVN